MKSGCFNLHALYLPYPTYPTYLLGQNQSVYVLIKSYVGGALA